MKYYFDLFYWREHKIPPLFCLLLTPRIALVDSPAHKGLAGLTNAKAIIIYTLMTLPIKRQVLDIVCFAYNNWFILPRML